MGCFGYATSNGEVTNQLSKECYFESCISVSKHIYFYISQTNTLGHNLPIHKETVINIFINIF